VSFPAGTTTQTIEIPIANDSDVEGSETFEVVLSNPVNVSISSGSGIVTIIDNDGGLTITSDGGTESCDDFVEFIVSGASNTVQVYAKAFSLINVDGQNSVSAFNPTTGILQSTLQFVGSGITDILTDSSQNIIRFNTPNYANSTISSLVTNISNLNNSISTTAGNFTTPFSSFIYNAISSFSTSIGGPIVTSANTAVKIQYGKEFLNQYGNTIVALPIPYINTNYNVQLTYIGNPPPSPGPSKILYTASLTTSNFTVYGDSNMQFNWVTFGNTF
jgi:hypothetical protein